MGAKFNFLKLLVWGLLSAVLVVGCGRGSSSEDLGAANRPVPAIVFPETGICDIHQIPAGTYKVARVKSYLLGTAASGKHVSASFEHIFSTPGKWADQDVYHRLSNFAGHEDRATEMNLAIAMNLPLELNVAGGKASFGAGHRYVHRVNSRTGGRWSIEGSPSNNGLEMHSIFGMPGAKQAAAPIYGDKLMRGTARLDGNTLTAYYETKVEKAGKVESHQVIEVSYVKQ